MARVTLDHITKQYAGGFKAVDDFNLDIADGEFVVFVGPSGCGKSTTLRLIAGLEEEFEGTIKIGDRQVNDLAPSERDIAMVFQNYALYPHMSVYSNMAMALKLRGINKAEIDRKVREAAAMLGIENLLDRKPGQLSGGQRQRVAVGRAIVRQPKAFLFDEPLSNLDAKMRVSTRAELKALHQRMGVTSIYVTHDQEEAMTLGDRIVVMAKGRIQQAAAPLDVYNNPANRFVASFVGTPPMNFFEGPLVPNDAARGTSLQERGARGATFAIGSRSAERAAAAGLREGVVGIRPQHFTLTPTPDTSSLTVTIESVEFLGEQVDIHASTHAGTKLTARLNPADNLRRGHTVQLFVPTDRVFFFEPGEFGRNLSSP